jgi:outer membrane protein, multidrug efflux system
MMIRFLSHFFLMFSAIVFGVVFLVSCRLLAPYKAPFTPTPAYWKQTYSEKEPFFEEICKTLDNWWEIFRDPVLNELEEQALSSSYTLWGALERVIEARAKARIDFAPLLPSITFNPSFSHTGSLYQNPLGSSFGTATTTTQSSTSMMSSASNQNAAATTPSLPSAFRFVESEYLVPLNLKYEVDLWNRLRDTYCAAVFRAQAASQAYLSVFLSLTADVAAAYFQIRGLDAQQDVIQNTIRIRRKTLEINRIRFDAGLVVYFDVSRAELELARAHSDGDDVKRLRGLRENMLATLVGVPASIFSVAYNPLSISPPVIPMGIPSDLLCRRPDIAEAERRLAAAYEEIGVAYTNFFPSFSLNAALGLSSPFARDLFTWKARFWQIGWNIMQTVFDAGRNQANLDYYTALFCEATANYQQQVLRAFQDVEDSLTNLHQYAVQAQDLSVAVRAARLGLELAQMRYSYNLVSYLDVIDAEKSLLETEQNSVIVLGNRYVSTVLLIRALGGGWASGRPVDDPPRFSIQGDDIP